MPKLTDIIDYLNTYLAVDEIPDNCWNGLQIMGKKQVAKIVFAVDAGKQTFTRAIEQSGDLVIVHHGHFWRSVNPALLHWSKERLEPLLQNNVSLYACHLPLDRHPGVGNNAQLLTLLGANIKKEFYFKSGKNISWLGTFSRPIASTDIVATLEQQLKTKCLLLPQGAEKNNSIAVITGNGGYDGFAAAIEAGVDLYITGDTSEIYHAAKDAGINVIFAGHYATETLGLKALSKIISKQFAVETEFIDIPTGL